MLVKKIKEVKLKTLRYLSFDKTIIGLIKQSLSK